MTLYETPVFKVGETVTILSRNGALAITKVARVLPSKMVLADGSEWRVNGNERGKGDSYYYKHVVHATAAHGDEACLAIVKAAK